MTRARTLSRLGNTNVITATSSNNIGIGTTTPDAKLDVIGIVSATSFSGDGSQLTGIDSTALVDSEGTTRVQANTSGANVTGVLTATSFAGDGTGLTGVASTDFIITGTAATFTSDVNIADSIIHVGDTDTKIRFPAADTFTVETAGSEALRVDSSQRLLIATSASQGKWNNSSGDDHIVQIESTSAFSQSWISHSTSATAGVQLDVGRSRGSSDGDTTLVNDGDLLGHLCFQGADGSQFVRGVRIAATVNGTPTADDMPTDLTFETNSGGNNSSERLRITAGGDILPGADATQDLGATDKRFANIYSADLQLSNEGSTNDVDGTWGKYTIQEGENDLFLINRRTGKKYKFNLTEVE